MLDLNSPKLIVSNYDIAKVLSVNSKEAKVYYVNTYPGNNRVGSVVTYTKIDGEWVSGGADTKWAMQGNADEIVWPYWHHSIRSAD